MISRRVKRSASACYERKVLIELKQKIELIWYCIDVPTAVPLSVRLAGANDARERAGLRYVVSPACRSTQFHPSVPKCAGCDRGGWLCCAPSVWPLPPHGLEIFCDHFGGVALNTLPNYRFARLKFTFHQELAALVMYSVISAALRQNTTQCHSVCSLFSFVCLSFQTSEVAIETVATC